MIDLNMSAYEIIISSSGALILVLLGIIGHISKRYFDEFRNVVKDIGKLEGMIALNRQKSEDDINSLTRHTELQIQQLTKNIDKLMNVFIEKRNGSHE